MLQTILQQITAFGAETFATTSLLGATAWSWIQAQPLWLTAGIAGGLKVLIGLVMLVRLLKKRSASAKPAPKRTSVAPRRRAEVIQTTPAHRPTPTQSARVLASRGLSEIEISKQSGLARDAVSLLLPADRAMPTRQGRPSAAGVAVPKAVRTSAIAASTRG
jgi:hypothetical protein